MEVILSYVCLYRINLIPSADNNKPNIQNRFYQDYQQTQAYKDSLNTLFSEISVHLNPSLHCCWRRYLQQFKIRLSCTGFCSIMQLQVLLLVVCVLGVNWGVSWAQCPPAEDIAPCVCRIPPFHLVCENVEKVEQLINVAENLQGSHYNFFGKVSILKLLLTANLDD